MAERFVINVIETYVDFTDMLMNDTNYKDQISRYFQRISDENIKPIYKHSKCEETGMYKCELYHKDKLIISGEGISKKNLNKMYQKKHYNISML